MALAQAYSGNSEPRYLEQWHLGLSLSQYALCFAGPGVLPHCSSRFSAGPRLDPLAIQDTGRKGAFLSHQFIHFNLWNLLFPVPCQEPN